MAEKVTFDETDTQPNPQSGEEAIDPSSIDKYQFIEEAFEGTGGFEDGKYIWNHSREMFYEVRRKRAYYANYIGPIIMAMYKPVFAEPISRDYGENQLYDKFVKNCTHSNLKLDNFVEMCVKYIRMHGMVLIVVDNKSQEGAELEQDVIKNNLYPYCYIKKANEINADGTTFDENGKLIEIMYFDHSEKEAYDTVNYYRQWTFTETKLYKENSGLIGSESFDKKYVLIESLPNLRGELPVSLMYEEPLNNPEDLFANTPRYQLAKINTAIFDQDSEGREVERNQGFGVLTVPESSAEKNDVVIGTHNYIGYPHDSRHAPDMISLDPNLIETLAGKRFATMECLLALAEQSGVQGINKSKDAKSGLAYAFEFYAYETTLITSSRIAINVEEEINRHFNAWTNNNVEYEKNYPTTFKPNKLEGKYQQIIDVLDMPAIEKELIDKCQIELYKILFPKEAEGLEILKKQLSQKKPELDGDIE